MNFSDLRLNGIKKQSYQGCIKDTCQIRSFVRIVNSITKSSIFDVGGVASETYLKVLELAGIKFREILYPRKIKKSQN